MNNNDLLSQMQDILILIDRTQEQFTNIQDNIQKSLEKVNQYQDDLKIAQSQLKSNLMIYYHQQQLNSVKESKPEAKLDNKPVIDMKNTEPMNVEDAIAFLRTSNVSLSDYGYRMRYSCELRYAALKDMLKIYSIEDVLQKLRALIIVWSQNTVDHIKSAEKYLNNLRLDFHTLQEESLKKGLLKKRM